MPPDSASAKKELDPIVFELIGRATSDWSGLDYFISESIWALALTPPPLGACITAQIYTTDGRLRALLALLKIRQADQKLIDTVNDFANEIRGPAEKRNRIVHDIWTVHEDTGAMLKVEITAQRKLTFEVKEVDLSRLRKDVQDILDCVKRCKTIRDQIFAALPSLPRIPLQVLHTTLQIYDPQT